MRIILATLLSAVVIAFLIISSRIWGLGQTYPQYNAEFLKGQTPYIIVKAETLAKAKAIVQQKPSAIIWLDVRLSSGKIPFILNPSRDSEFLKLKEEQQYANPTAKIMQGGKLSDYSWEQINEFYKDTPSLKEMYEQLPETRFILNVVDNVADAHTSVVSAIEGFNPDNRTLIQADATAVRDSIKDLKPTWVYGTSRPDIMRLLSFDSLYVLPATQFKGDVFIAPFKVLKRPAFNEDIVVEMRRRHKPIFLGPITTDEELNTAVRLKADGYIVNDLNDVLSKLPKQ